MARTGHDSAVEIASRISGPENGPQIADLCTATIRAVAQGVVGIAFIQMLLIGIGFVVMGIPGAGLLALAVLLLGIMQLPATLITIPVIIFVIATQGVSTMTIIFSVYVFVAGLADNVLKPLLLGRGVAVPMPVVLIGALGGMVTGGVIGLFIGPVMLAVGYQLFWRWVKDQAKPERLKEEQAASDAAGADPCTLRHHSARPYWLLLAAALLLSGCMRVGPDFHPQHESWSEHWSSASIEQVTQQAAQPDIRQWWQIFADQNLESLIAQADANNGDVKIAGLRVLEARAQLGIALAGRYPQVQQANADVLVLGAQTLGWIQSALGRLLAVRRGLQCRLGAGFLGALQPRDRVGRRRVLRRASQPRCRAGPAARTGRRYVFHAAHGRGAPAHRARERPVAKAQLRDCAKALQER